jgi:hypothetical protein
MPELAVKSQGEVMLGSTHRQHATAEAGPNI